MIIYYLQLDDVTGADFENTLYAFRPIVSSMCDNM